MNMKKFLMILFVGLGLATSVNAQSLMQEVHEKATAIVNNPSSSEEQVNINQFKITALNYIVTQVSKRDLKKDSYFFDCQAVNLQTFISEFMANLMKARQISTEKKQQVIDCYRKATLDNTLFNDTEKEKVQTYVNEANSPTPFSLDTDWEKAYDQATKNVKQILK